MNDQFQEIGPNRVIGSGTATSWLVYILATAVLLSLAAGVWYIAAPVSLARVTGKLFGPPLEIRKLSLVVNKEKVELEPGGSITVHPEQPFSIGGLDTNRRLNYDLTFFSPDFDMAKVTGAAYDSVASLLQSENFDQPRELTIVVRDDDTPVAEFKIIALYSAVDLAARGDAAADPAEKAASYEKALTRDPNSLAVQEKYVAALVESGQLPKAAAFLEKDLSRNSPDEKKLERLFQIYSSLGNTEKRIETLQRRIKLAEEQKRSSVELRRLLADIHRQNNQIDKAAESLESLIAGAEPSEAKTHLGELVKMYRDSGHIDREIEALRRLLDYSSQKEKAAIWLEISSLYHKTGNRDGFADARFQAAALMPQGPDKTSVYTNTARQLYEAKDYEKAMAAYQEAFKSAPEDESIALNMSRLALNMGSREQYRANLSKAVELKPENLDYRRELAAAMREDGLKNAAKKQYAELLQRTPDDQNVRLILMELMDQTGDKDGLIKQYEELAARRPDDKVVAYNYAALLFERKKWDQAISAFQKVKQLDPADLPAREYLVAAYQRKKMNKEMLAEALEVYRRGSSKVEYRTLLLNTYENDKNWKSYAEVAKTATELKPGDPAAWELLAKAQTQLAQSQSGQAQLKLKKEAALSLLRAAEASGNKAAPWVKAGEALAATGQKSEANKAYEKALKIDPNNKQATRALKALAASK